MWSGSTTVLSDVRYALRSLARTKGTTAVLLLSLAAGTGANAVLYGVLAGLLFRPPPGIDVASLVTISTSQFSGATHGASSYPDFLSLAAERSAFAGMAAFDDGALEEVELGGLSHRVRVVAATEDLFAVLGDPAPDRRLTRAAPTGIPPALISHALWWALDAPADAVGRVLRVADREFVIRAVLPERFRGLRLGRACDVWIPLETEAREGRGDRRLSIVARLAGGVALDEAQARATARALDLAVRFPETNRGTRTNADEPRRLTVLPYSRVEPGARARFVQLSTVVLGATALLLVSACVNAASLLAARSAARRRELAVKVALGASRRGLVRAVLIESLLLSVGGVVLGLVAAHWTAGILPALLAPEEASLLDTSLDVVSLAVAMGVAIVAGGLFAIGPARHATSTPDAEALRADSGSVSSRTRGGLARPAIVVGQVALSTVLLVGAGFLVQALSVALDGDLGPGGRGVAIALVKMPEADAGNVIRGASFQRAASDAVRKIPGVEAAGWVTTLPINRSGTRRFELEVGPGLVDTAEVDTNVASADYFRTLRIPVVEGRPFDHEDAALAPPVAIVNDVLARRYFGPSAVGHYLRDEQGTAYAIVGVVGSGRYRTFQEAPEPMVYYPLSQKHQFVMHVLARTAGSPEPVLPLLRERLVAIDRAVDVRWLKTFEDHLEEALVFDRVMTTTVAACGVLALALATIGVYGVIADAVRRRTPEIGLRVALGARRREIVLLVLAEGTTLGGLGALLGVVIAGGATKVLGTFVHGLPPLDVVSVTVVGAGLVLVVVGGAVLPTWRALRISPTIALRAE
jgi:predicted permease